MKSLEWKNALIRGDFDTRLSALYGAAALPREQKRYRDAITAFETLFGVREVCLFSVPGRSELSGNHTDHNHGCVIAASVDLDIIAVAAATDDGVVRVKSEGFPEDVVVIADRQTPDPARFACSDAIIAGMCRGFADRGHAVGGFVAYTTSDVPGGSGLSSSAAFEMAIGAIENQLYNGGRVKIEEIAGIAQYAENVFFGKPCGRMDQLASGEGGMIAIDFADPENPVIDKIDFDLTAAGYALCIVKTGGNHADLTDDYAAVSGEMRAVAAAMGATVLRQTKEADVLAALPDLRAKVGDRAVLRALHFFDENRRVAEQKKALQRGDLTAFFENVIASGRSSFCYLQNVYTTRNAAEQGLSLALYLAERYLVGKPGAFRVHGGGFAGTIQVFLRQADVPGFVAWMDGVFGTGATLPLHVRTEGAVVIG